MSLLKNNIPRKTREVTGQVATDLYKEPVSISDNVVIGSPRDEKEVMIEEYAYHPEEPAEKEVELSSSDKLLKSSTLSFYDLSFFCEERIHIILHEPVEVPVAKVNNIYKEFINKKLEVYSNYSKDVALGNIKDKLFFKDGYHLIPEEYLIMSGVLREYLKIEEALVLFQTGEIKLLPTHFCNFWTEDRLNKLSVFNPNNIKNEQLSKKACQACNLRCNFRPEQQIAK
jgi:hypothetical protein